MNFLLGHRNSLLGHRIPFGPQELPFGPQEPLGHRNSLLGHRNSLLGHRNSLWPTGTPFWATGTPFWAQELPFGHRNSLWATGVEVKENVRNQRPLPPTAARGSRPRAINGSADPGYPYYRMEPRYLRVITRAPARRGVPTPNVFNGSPHKSQLKPRFF
jgi:hypothetical protein